MPEDVPDDDADAQSTASGEYDFDDLAALAGSLAPGDTDSRAKALLLKSDANAALLEQFAPDDADLDELRRETMRSIAEGYSDDGELPDYDAVFGDGGIVQNARELDQLLPGESGAEARPDDLLTRDYAKRNDLLEYRDPMDPSDGGDSGGTSDNIGSIVSDPTRQNAEEPDEDDLAGLGRGDEAQEARNRRPGR